jgi:hydrogenase maturation protein HypF
MKRFFRVDPVGVAHDLHPQYLSTRFALGMDGIRKIGVQHHHAHVASCMAENHLDGAVIGVAFDGTGYGTDGAIWGGEFLVCDYTHFERLYHLRYIPLAGGDTAVRQIWRSGLAYLIDAGLDPKQRMPSEVDPAALRVVQQMVQRGVNTVSTSSCGRLFDAVAAILGIRSEANFEGQGAMELEAVSAATDLAGFHSYPYEIQDQEIDLREMIRALAGDAGRPALAGARFHQTLSVIIRDVCQKIADRKALRRVCLSGGTFQNMLLLHQTVRLLREAQFEVFLHSQIPANDGGLSLGQAAIANQLLKVIH